MSTSSEKYIWAIAANIIDYLHTEGPNHELQLGTRHFSPGGKVYFSPYPLWGDGFERIKVIGRHRKGRRFIEVIISYKLLRNFRPQKVFHPTIIKMIEPVELPHDTETDEQQAIKISNMLNVRGILRGSFDNSK